MGKHAYLIMAHNEPKALEILIELLDDPRNTLYIHIDKECDVISESLLEKKCERSQIKFLEREDVFWSGYSQVHVSLKLLKMSLKDHNDYYHFISGVDLPLKTQDELHLFFDKNKGDEFVSCGEFHSWNVARRYKFYHFEKLTKYMGRKIYKIFCYFLDLAQTILFIDLSKSHKMKYYMGGNWFSITHNFGEYLVSQEKFIRKTFKYGYLVDEIFLPTLLMNSPFKNKVSEKMNLRYVDWDRGNPYVWQEQDFEELITKDIFFARKFSFEEHPIIMQKIKNYLLT